MHAHYLINICNLISFTYLTWFGSIIAFHGRNKCWRLVLYFCFRIFVSKTKIWSQINREILLYLKGGKWNTISMAFTGNNPEKLTNAHRHRNRPYAQNASHCISLVVIIINRGPNVMVLQLSLWITSIWRTRSHGKREGLTSVGRIWDSGQRRNKATEMNGAQEGRSGGAPAAKPQLWHSLPFAKLRIFKCAQIAVPLVLQICPPEPVSPECSTAPRLRAGTYITGRGGIPAPRRWCSSAHLHAIWPWL